MHGPHASADFGLAKLGGDLSLTGTAELPGTLRYLAPECLRDESDERSDVYSLGLTLYELLLGRPAFAETDRVRLLREVQEAQIVPPRVLVPSVPRDLETILLRALAREPSDRYETARALADDLRRFLDDRPIVARRPSWLERGVRLARRNPLPASLAATTLLFAMIAAYFLRLYVKAPPRPDPPPPPGLVDGPDDPPPPPPPFRGPNRPRVGPQGRPLPGPRGFPPPSPRSRDFPS